MAERIKVSTLDGYAKWAESYDSYPNGLIKIEEPRVRGFLGEVAGKRVLDAGCGTGRHTQWLVERGARVTGVDPSPEMLAHAKVKCPGAELLLGTFAPLPATDRAFDLALNALVLEHLPEVAGPIAELARVVVPGGAIVVSVFHPFFVLRGIPAHFKHVDAVEYEMPSHVHLVSDYVRAVKQAGLVLEDLVEPVVDDALIAALPNFHKHRGHPLAVIFKASKP